MLIHLHIYIYWINTADQGIYLTYTMIALVCAMFDRSRLVHFERHRSPVGLVGQNIPKRNLTETVRIKIIFMKM